MLMLCVLKIMCESSIGNYCFVGDGLRAGCIQAWIVQIFALRDTPRLT